MEGSLLVLHQAEGTGIGFPRHLKPAGPPSWFLTRGCEGLWGLLSYPRAGAPRGKLCSGLGILLHSLPRGLDLQSKTKPAKVVCPIPTDQTHSILESSVLERYVEKL